MASTYSALLGLELMATGDQSGTWGNTTNTNLGTLLEQAIAGYLSVAQGDATLTLTDTDGASNQARNAVINLTGAMTANRDVVVPTSAKLYVIKNSTTGGFSTVVKTAAGTGITVLNGQSRFVYCDGTNVVDALSLGTLATQNASAAAITGGTATGLTSITMASGAATPATNDAAALGTSTLMWSDLFLASGAVVNWNNGDVTLTHSANTLAFAGASSGYTFDVAIGAGSGGTGISSYTAGDILYATGATTLAKLAKGTAGQVLTMNSGATAPEWAAGSMTLLGTLTTTSGTTQSLTSIPAGYVYLYCEVRNVSFGTAAALTLATSSTNGAAYGTAGSITGTLANNGFEFGGVIEVYNIGSTTANAKTAWSSMREVNSGSDRSVAAVAVPTNSAAVVDAIQFAGSGGATFDAGSIRIYGVR